MSTGVVIYSRWRINGENESQARIQRDRLYGGAAGGRKSHLMRAAA
jgi:hypothetical protein